jgi:hypothetical protein
VKPTFKGRMNLTKTGAGVNEQSEGVVKSYDFGSVFKTENPSGENREGNPEERKQGGRRGGRGGFNKGGRPFGRDDDKKEEDDEFELVKDKKRV